MSEFEHYLEGAEKGHPNSMGMVGQCYLLGDGVEKDLDKAEEWLKKAIDAGSLFAMLRLAEAHFIGGPLERDNMLAWKYAVSVSRANTSDTALIGWAEHLLARFFFEGVSPCRRDADEALKLLQAAKSHHCPLDVDSNIAIIRKRKEEAYQQFKKGINKHPLSAEGHYEMGLYYKKGDGGYNHYEAKAAESFKKAAKKGHAEAQYELAQAYNEGRGVKKDRASAEEWCNKAAKNGCEKAEAYLRNFEDWDSF